MRLKASGVEAEASAGWQCVTKKTLHHHGDSNQLTQLTSLPLSIFHSQPSLYPSFRYHASILQYTYDGKQLCIPSTKLVFQNGNFNPS